ncbi:MAG: antitoxin [Candidatus Altiarchaeales archaeon HGW-Altiarchaeales-3]|nr:MAG: antitoxin [Candidatus Altiarchaeales archaeon HGW-Altiarchaeales-3]
MRTEVNEYIVADTEICHGKPTFKGTRIMVSDIIELVADGVSNEKIIDDYPSLNNDMIRSALEHAARIMRRKEHYVKFKVPA